MSMQPFTWGAGGSRHSIEDITQRRRLAMANMAAGADASPVGHWTQGLARVAQGLAGGFQMRGADRLAEERATAQQDILANLMSYDPAAGGADPVAAALADPELRDIGVAMWKARQAPAVEPSIQRRNDGSIIGLNPMTGEIMFEQADPNPKPSLDWLSVKNEDGTTTLVPIGVGGPMTGAPQGGPPATLPPDFDFGEPTIRNTPAPELGANGMPTEVTRQQYQAIVNAKGQAATDEWARRNNITVRN